MGKKLFLPVGLLVAVAVACMAPGPGAFLRAHWGVQIFVVTIFLINGWTVKRDGGHPNRRLGLALFAACALSLGVGPWVGVWVARSLFGLDGALGTGLIVMASVPVTLSSAIVLSTVAGGNAVWALLMTMGMNLAGIFTVPAMLRLCMQDAGTARISVPSLLLKLVGLVLVPFLIGHMCRRMLSWKTHRLLGYVPSLCVVLTVYAAFAASRDDMLAVEPQAFPVVLAAALTIHILLFALANGLSRFIGQTPAERKTFCFVSSQKSLPIAVSVLAALAMDSALVLLPCLLFHFSQLLLDSCIAVQWGRQPAAVASAKPPAP